MSKNNSELRVSSKGVTPPSMRVLAHADSGWTKYLVQSALRYIEFKKGDVNVPDDVTADDFDADVVDGEYVVFADDEAAGELLMDIVETLRFNYRIFELPDEDWPEFDTLGGDKSDEGMIYILRNSGLSDAEIADTIPWVKGYWQVPIEDEI